MLLSKPFLLACAVISAASALPLKAAKPDGSLISRWEDIDNEPASIVKREEDVVPSVAPSIARRHEDVINEPPAIAKREQVVNEPPVNAKREDVVNEPPSIAKKDNTINEPPSIA
ncbi:hypothetical protein K445DRAFT_10028 [Daldinia sp. EC12]|nr:hypothetical protein K445DRAFT_10028 [Daldinia sp. EC12]